MDVFISQVEKGRSFTVVRKSTPIFKITPVDEWGDEGHWETIVDFEKETGKAMPINDFIKLLENASHRKVPKKGSGKRPFKDK